MKTLIALRSVVFLGAALVSGPPLISPSAHALPPPLPVGTIPSDYDILLSYMWGRLDGYAIINNVTFGEGPFVTLYDMAAHYKALSYLFSSYPFAHAYFMGVAEVLEWAAYDKEPNPPQRPLPPPSNP